MCRVEAVRGTGEVWQERVIEIDPRGESVASSEAGVRQEVEDVVAHSWDDSASGRLLPGAQTARFPVHRVAHKADLFSGLPAGWQTRACIVKRLRQVPDPDRSKLGMDQSCPCPLGPCELTPGNQTPH